MQFSEYQDSFSWEKVSYRSHDWANVNYDALSDQEIKLIKWNKVDLAEALKSKHFRFDAIDWEKIKKYGGVNVKKAFKALNSYEFDVDNDSINLKYLSSVKEINSGGGNDVVIGNSRDNKLQGGNGNDTLKGMGEKTDFMEVLVRTLYMGDQALMYFMEEIIMTSYMVVLVPISFMVKLVMII